MNLTGLSCHWCLSRGGKHWAAAFFLPRSENACLRPDPLKWVLRVWNTRVAWLSQCSPHAKHSSTRENLCDPGWSQGFSQHQGGMRRRLASDRENLFSDFWHVCSRVCPLQGTVAWPLMDSFHRNREGTKLTPQCSSLPPDVLATHNTPSKTPQPWNPTFLYCFCLIYF